MKRVWVSLALIACMGLALVILDQFTPSPLGKFLQLALAQKHSLMLLLAAQAALIVVITSGVVEKPVVKAATIIAGLTIFAAELGQLDQEIPTGLQIAVVVLVPIGLTLTNIMPIPKTTRGWLAVTLTFSIAMLGAVLAITNTKAGLILAIIFGEEIVITVLATLMIVSFALAVASFLGLIGVVQGQNTQPARTGRAGGGKKKKKSGKR